MGVALTADRFATTKWRGAMMGAVFAMQGFGQLTGAIVALVTVVGFKQSFSMSTGVAACTGPCALAADKTWRVLIGRVARSPL
jgi:PHS family inorganic phosphate transporter-like MFS transporter